MDISGYRSCFSYFIVAFLLSSFLAPTRTFSASPGQRQETFPFWWITCDRGWLLVIESSQELILGHAWYVHIWATGLLPERTLRLQFVTKSGDEPRDTKSKSHGVSELRNKRPLKARAVSFKSHMAWLGQPRLLTPTVYESHGKKQTLFARDAWNWGILYYSGTPRLRDIPCWNWGRVNRSSRFVCTYETMLTGLSTYIKVCFNSRFNHQYWLSNIKKRALHFVSWSHNKLSGSAFW